MEYRRNLPHLHPDSAPIFVTWRLFGSLPAFVHRKLLKSCPTPGQTFAAKDRLLDRASGPKWLCNPLVAEFVAHQIRRGDADRSFYILHAWVIMPNHVHLLITPRVPVPRITRWLKGSTANHANKLLGFTGHRFWRDESWDHCVRNEGELRRITRYVEMNPVSAGLAASPEKWPYSSASRI